MREKVYNNTIQVMRALAVIMVVLQHSISRIATTNFDYKVMYALNHIDVAVFFVIAGYLFESKKEKYYSQKWTEYIVQKWKTLLIPYLFWSLILAVGIKVSSMVFPAVQNLFGTVWSWHEILINTIFFRDYYVQHLWFIYILFFFFVIHRILKDYLTDKRTVFLVLLVSVVLNRFSFGFILDKFILHFGTFLLGRIIFKYHFEEKNNIKSENKLWNMGVSIFVIGVLGICFWSEYVYKNSFTYSYLGNLVYAMSGIYIVYLIAGIIGSIGGLFRAVMNEVGDYSFEIYLMHNPYVSVLAPLLLRKCWNQKEFVVVGSTVLGVLVPYFIAKILMKSKWISQLLFGRKGRKK